MPKKTRHRSFGSNKKTRKRKKRGGKIVSFAAKTSLGEPVIDHSKRHHDLFANMTEIHL